MTTLVSEQGKYTIAEDNFFGRYVQSSLDVETGFCIGFKGFIGMTQPRNSIGSLPLEIKLCDSGRIIRIWGFVPKFDGTKWVGEEATGELLDAIVAEFLMEAVHWADGWVDDSFRGDQISHADELLKRLQTDLHLTDAGVTYLRESMQLGS